MDWLSRLLDMMPVAGHLDIRCTYGAPWRIEYDASTIGTIPYHIVLAGSALIADPDSGSREHLAAGDIVILTTGVAHILHDGSDAPAFPNYSRPGLNHTISENIGTGQRVDMLCGHFSVSSPHDRLIRSYLPPRLIVRGSAHTRPGEQTAAGTQLKALIGLIRMESDTEDLGGGAMLNAYSAALFTLALRLASEAEEAPPGLLALAGHPRVAPALAAMFEKPAHPWTLPELANLCNMSRATMARHFQEKLGRSASDLLLDIRMTLAANELKKPGASTAAVAEAAGYQSEAAFQRIFKQRMGVTPSQWRRGVHSPG